jgi:hypothetical protein
LNRPGNQDQSILESIADRLSDPNFSIKNAKLAAAFYKFICKLLEDRRTFQSALTWLQMPRGNNMVPFIISQLRLLPLIGNKLQQFQLEQISWFLKVKQDLKSHT